MTNPQGHSEPREESILYELEDSELQRPALPGAVVVMREEDELIDRLAAELVLHAENCVREFGDFHLALSAGPTFERLYRRLMYDPNYRWLPWRRTHLWLTAEHCVPFDDERCCYRMISEIVGDHADIPQEQFHPIFAQSETVVDDYETQIREALAWREKGQDRLDYVLLTVGPDGRTAGLLPGSSALRDQEHLVGVSGDSMNADRVTLTLPFINAARFIAVLMTGPDQASTVQRLVDDGDALPISGVAPINGELRWYLDGAAASA